MEGGREKQHYFLEGFQRTPARPSDSSIKTKMYMQILEW